MSKIEDMMQEFKDLAELKDFTRAQHESIMNLTRKVKKLEEEKSELESMLVGKLPSNLNSSSLIQDVGAYEETICRMELKKLHDRSLEQQLTYEEAKKVEIYTKLLISINSKEKKEDLGAGKIETGDLLKLVVDNNDAKQSE